MERKTLAEAIGTASVVASLVFVGLQIKQTGDVTRAATVLDLKENWAQLNLTYLEAPDVGAAFRTVNEIGYNESDPRTQFLVASAYRAIMHNWSNAYFQYRMGTLDDEQWTPLRNDMAADSRNPNLWLIWDDWYHIFDEPFVTLMDSLRTANQPG